MSADAQQHPYFTTGKLPPKPDVRTGQPRPPRAPRVSEKDVFTPRGRKLRKHPQDPPGELGPRLEWQQQSVVGSLASGAFASGFVLVACLLFAGMDAVTLWFLWLIYIVTGMLVGFTMNKAWIAAGAAWCQNKKTWVNTYDLVDVKIGTASASHTLKLKDVQGNYIEPQLREVQENPDLWDLVYNGILHSVVTGKASVSPGHRKILGLPRNN